MKEDLEVWKPISGWEDSFAVSTIGQIKALPRMVGSNNGQRRITEKIRKAHKSPTGKLLITLSDRTSKTYSVDRLVAEAFIPNPNPCKLKYVRHRDEDENNCDKSNLYWSKIRNKKPASPRKIKGDAHVCPQCGKVSLYEQKSAQSLKENYFCGKCRYKGPLGTRPNTQRMANLRADHARGGWGYEALAAKYQVAVSTAWLWVNRDCPPIQN